MNLEAGKSAERLPNNVEIVDTPEARFRLIYDFHAGRYGIEGNAHSAEELGNADAFAMEAPSTQDFAEIEHAQRRAGVIVDLSTRKPTENAADPAEYVVQLQERQTPVYFIDLIEPDSTYHYAGMASMAGGAAASVGGGILAAGYLAEKIKKNDPVNRRDLLKGAAAAALVAKGTVQAADFILSTKSTLEGHIGGESAKPGGIEKSVRNVAETINPETYALFATFRDSVWAHKLYHIAMALHQARGRRPEIAVQIGRNHVNFTAALKADPEKRLSYIKNAWKVVDSILSLKEKGVRISSVARLEYVNGRWMATDAYRDSKLKEIEG